MKHDEKVVAEVYEREWYDDCNSMRTARALTWKCKHADRPPVGTKLIPQSAYAELAAELEEVRNERDAFAKHNDLLTHKLITCGVAAHHPDPNLSKTGAYAGKWDSPQAQDVRALRDRCDAAESQLAERDALAASVVHWRMKNEAAESQLAELRGALERFVRDAEEVDLGGGDAVVTTCESLELAKSALAATDGATTGETK